MVLRSMKSLLVLAFSLFTILLSTSLLANDTTQNHVAEHPVATDHEAKEESFNVTETILEHITVCNKRFTEINKPIRIGFD